MVDEYGKRGNKLNPVLRRRIVETLADAEMGRWKRARQAKALGISVYTLRMYLVPSVLADIEARWRRPFDVLALENLDKAMLEKALNGNIAAAKVMYTRLVSKAEDGAGDEPTLEDIEAMVALLKGAPVKP
jgi:hypothetical protein